jgi:hypothetical protein
VIKALLTAVTASTCEVHEHSLMLAVRACYHIHLSSRNLINRTTAKATLTQMLNISFQSMETVSLELDKLLEEKEKAAQLRRASTPKSGSFSSSLAGAKAPITESGAEGGVDSNADGGDSGAAAADVPEGVAVVQHCLQALIIGAVRQSKSPKGKFGWCTMCGNTANHYCLQTKVPICSVACKQAHLDMLSSSPPSAGAGLAAQGYGGCCIIQKTGVMYHLRCHALHISLSSMPPQG